MGKVSTLELLVGIKAEQSLRDEVRTAVDEAGSESVGLELTPVGPKDWIAGARVGTSISFMRVTEVCAEVLTKLIALKSMQRIRMENIRFYVVPPPVPVFKDPPSPEFSDDAPKQKEDSTAPDVSTFGNAAQCPICGRTVNSYNLQHNTKGDVVGCFICGGDPGIRRS
jgi:hypothetical protein